MKIKETWSSSNKMTREIPLSKILYGTNVRSELDEDIMELAKSIEDHDILQPLVVRPKGNKYEVICGHRRFRALQLVGGDITVPCIIRDDISDSDLLRVQLEENIQRKQMSAIELVDAFEKMKKQSKRKLTNEQIAAMLNKNLNWVANQYYAVKNIEKVYGDNGKDYVHKHKIGAGKIIADLQKKRREATKVKKNGFSVEHLGTTITIKCDSKDMAAYVLSELKKI